MRQFGMKFKAYAGQWVAFGEDGVVVSTDDTAATVRARAESARPGERPKVAWISPHPPHVAMPAWPLAAVRRVAADRDIWLAGGPVRDLLLGRPPHDWDFVVVEGGLALARQVADLLAGAYYPLDAARGTGRVIITDADRETAQRRSLPAPKDKVEHRETDIILDFAELRAPDIRTDLAARDFTINAMALSLDGRLIDPTDGQADLAAGRLRLTHPGAFRDDPARLLRAIRQAYQLGFTITPRTLEQLRADAPLLEDVAAERVRDELVKLMTLERVSAALRDLASLGLLPHILPALAPLSGAPRGTTPQAYPTMWDRVRARAGAAVEIVRWLTDTMAEPSGSLNATLPATPIWLKKTLSEEIAGLGPVLQAYLRTAVSNLDRSDLLPWGALLHPVPERVEGQLTDLRFANREIRFVKQLIAGPAMYEELVEMRRSTISDRQPGVTRRDAYRYYHVTGDAGAAGVLLALAMALADRHAEISREAWDNRFAVARTLLRTYFLRYDEVVEPPPLMNGRDLLAMGVPAGPKMGKILAVLKEEQAAGELTTEEEARAHVRRLLKDGGAHSEVIPT
jgi:tRNA nucleotidyltransferase/poly(A) polymerase